MLAAPAAATAAPEAILVITGDQHSAYERTAQFVALVDRLRAENPGVPLAVLIDGDTFEFGNVAARRSAGAVEFAMFAALAGRVPTVLNLGNHEPEFYDLADTVARVQATGVTVIGNAVDRATGKAFAPAMARLKLGGLELAVVGVTTDRLATYRAAVRPSLDLADPAVWARAHFPALLADEPLPVVLSHAGLKADRAMLALVPDGTLFAGAHDHLRFVHREGRTVYFHSGCWNEAASVARLGRDADGPRWDVEPVLLDAAAPGDPRLAETIRQTLEKTLTPEDRAIVGRTARALAPGEAARFVVEAVRAATGADAAVIGATTFGSGLPAGGVSRFAFDACVRFDGTLCVGEIDGAALRRLLAGANQGPDTPFAERRGENLIFVAPKDVVPGKRYRIATNDWAAKNAAAYFGGDAPVWQERPELKLKAVVTDALQRP